MLRENKPISLELNQSGEGLILERLQKNVERLSKEHEELVASSVLSDQEIDEILALNKSEQWYFRLLNETLKRIREETAFFKHFDELEIPVEGQKKKIAGVRISKSSVQDPRVTGQYFLLFNEIHLKGGWPLPGDILSHLAKFGSLGEVLNTLLHELIHSKQRGPWIWGKAASLIQEITIPNTELAETHSFTIASEDYYRSISELFQHINEGYPKVGYKINPDKLRYSLIAVNQLAALGNDISEIGEMVGRPGSWDEKSQTYPRIETEIMRQAKHTFASDDQEFVKECLNELLISHKTFEAIQREKARLITQEILKKEVLDQQKSEVDSN